MKYFQAEHNLDWYNLIDNREMRNEVDHLVF